MNPYREPRDWCENELRRPGDGRRGVGIELKAAYYAQAVKNLESAGEPVAEEPDMFAEAEV